MSDNVCIIGAGVSGLAAMKVFADRGIPFDAFEMGSDVGGIWRYENDNGRAVAYRSLQTNTSRDKTAFSDYAMPASYPDYPSHEQMLAYLEGYADYFGLREHVRFRTRVDRVSSGPSGEYEVRFRSLDSHGVHANSYRALVVASGHHWKPFCPDVDGTFRGRTLHSMEYRVPDDLRGRRVMVVGIGNSACDIVCEVSRVAERTILSTRRSAHVIPKYLLGRPVDKWLSPCTSRLPLPVRRHLFELLIFLERGSQSHYGLRVPDHVLGAEHPTISTDLLPLIERGAIHPKPDLESYLGDRVRFMDGSEEVVDVIIFATGYETCFPFLDFLEVRDSYLPLFHHVVHPSHRHLYFIGLVQPLGAIPPLAEAQSNWIADLLSGSAGLPSETEMIAAIRRDAETRQDRYVNSRRHRVEIDWYPYVRALKRARSHPA